MRQGDTGRYGEFLDRALSGPAGMVVEGEAGMGKTTFLWNVANKPPRPKVSGLCRRLVP